MDNDLVKKIISVGDLFERMLINDIKIKHFDSEKSHRVVEDNKSILKALCEFINIDDFQKESLQLSEVLTSQWDALDEVHNKNLDDVTRGKFAIMAQDMNADRIKYKNIINKKAGSNEELKSYGRDNI